MQLLFRAVFLFLCLTGMAQDLKYQSLLLKSSLSDGANAIVRLDEMKIELTSYDKMYYEVNQVVTVLNSQGNRFGMNRVGYDKEKKIKDLDVYVYDNLGNEIEHIKKKDFEDISVNDGISLYTDDRMLVHRYTPISYPYTIVLKYSVESTDTGFFPQWYFLPDYNVSVEKSSYTINYGKTSLKPHIKEYNLGDIEVKKEESPGKITYEASEIEALKQEQLSPSYSKITPHLRVQLKQFSLKGETASFQDWNDFGLWIGDSLLRGMSELNESTIHKARSLVHGVTNTLDKAKIIYKYVQDNTRYISVQIGIGGWKPISAFEVDNVKYGDCKGLSNYTHALLKAVGVESYYTVIEAGNGKVDFEDDFAGLQGNHAILAIPYNNQYYWIDCTSQVHPFGFLGNFTDDRKALIVKPEGGELVRTTSYLNEENYQSIRGEYSLDESGNISGLVDILTKGIQYDSRFYLESEPKDNIIKYYQGNWNNINNLKIESHSFENDRDSIQFMEKISLSASKYASLSGDRILFSVNAFNNNGFVPDRYRIRKFPFEISRGYLDEDFIKVKIPKGYVVEALPENVLEENEFGRYEVSFEFQPITHAILFKRNLFIKRGFYPKEKYGEYRDFRKKTAKMDNSQIVLIKK